MAGTNIIFYAGTKGEYDNLKTKNANGIYFLTDTNEIYKGDVKYSTVDKIATGQTAGIIKPGADFDIATDGTLSLYKPMAINSFGHNSGILEMGASITATTFSWNLNKAPKSLKLVSGGQPTAMPNQSTGTFVMNFTTPLKTTTTFNLQAVDARDKMAQANSTITFLNGKYHGVSTVNSEGQINNDFIKGLTKNLTGSRNGSFTVNAAAGQYIYFAIPTRFGTPAFFVGGFEGGFDKIKTFEYTNPSGFKENYDVWKTAQAGLGQTTVEVR